MAGETRIVSYSGGDGLVYKAALWGAPNTPILISHKGNRECWAATCSELGVKPFLVGSIAELKDVDFSSIVVIDGVSDAVSVRRLWKNSNILLCLHKSSPQEHAELEVESITVLGRSTPLPTWRQ